VEGDNAVRKIPTVWYVDDLTSQLDKFEADHGRVFEVRKFTNPQNVIDELKESRPDALLCDLFFYEPEETARQIEEQVLGKAQELRQFASSIGADREEHQAGITLIEHVFSHFRGKPPFPVYAYTSKAPYMLSSNGFDRIGRSGAKWLFKGRYSRKVEQLLISQDIRQFRFIKYLPTWLRNMWSFAIANGIIGWCLIEGGKHLVHMFRWGGQ